MTRPIADVYRELCATPSDINEHLPLLVEMVQQVGAVNVVELGVRHGVSTVAFLHALEATDGHLWSVDRIFPNDEDPIRSVDHARWTFVRGDDMSHEVYVALPSEIDILFIDTSHTFEHTKNELMMYGRRVRPKGRIILHDTMENAVEPDFPVRRAIQEWINMYPADTWVNYPNNNGLGVITT